MDTIYTKSHTILYSPQNGTERKMTVKIEIENINGISNKDLYLQITDDDSLKFLFCLKINQEIFHEIKTQQGLLIDYSAFSHKLIDLFELCKSEENNSSSKYILKLSGPADIPSIPSTSSTWTLHFVETNPFKHLTHLSLKLQHGDSEQFKAYLIQCLKKSRLENVQLNTNADSTKEALTSKLKQTEEILKQTQSELSRYETSSSMQIEELTKKQDQLMNSHREKIQETEEYYRRKNDQDKRDLESNLTTKINALQSKLNEVDKTNKCLLEENSSLESTVRDLKKQNESLHNFKDSSNQEIYGLRKCREDAEKTTHEMECQTQRMHTRIAVLEQEVRDKDQLAAKNQELIKSEQENRIRYYNECKRKSQQADKLEKAVKSLNEEVAKGNGIISKLQDSLKHYQSKIKVREQIATEQEKLLSNKDDEIEKLQQKVRDLERRVDSIAEEKLDLEKKYENTCKKLEEANHVIKTNENVINWLNRQVTEFELLKQQKRTNHLATSPSPTYNPSSVGDVPAGSSSVHSNSQQQFSAKYRPLSSLGASNQISSSIATTTATISNSIAKPILTNSTANTVSIGMVDFNLIGPKYHLANTNMSKPPAPSIGLGSTTMPTHTVTGSNNTPVLSAGLQHPFPPSSYQLASTLKHSSSKPPHSSTPFTESTHNGADTSLNQHSLTSSYFPRALIGPK